MTRTPATVLPPCYADQMATLAGSSLYDLSWESIGRRHYALGFNRGELIGAAFDLNEILITMSPYPIVLHTSEIAQLRAGYEAEQRATLDPVPTEGAEYTEAYACYECGTQNPFHPARPLCLTCRYVAGLEAHGVICAA